MSDLNYEQQRYERLLETVDEYLCSNGTDDGPLPLLRDLFKACEDLKKWPNEQLSNIKEVQSRLLPNK
jgi:flagellar hook-associated protein FlgK